MVGSLMKGLVGDGRRWRRLDDDDEEESYPLYSSVTIELA